MIRKSWQLSKLKLKSCVISDINVDKILTDIFIRNLINNHDRINMPITAFRVRKKEVILLGVCDIMPAY